MKKSSWVSLLLFTACVSSQWPQHNSSVVPSPTKLAQVEPNSAFGKYFTPQGDLRALVIYVNFEEEYLDKKVHNNLPYWPIQEEFPVHRGKSVVQEDQSLSWGFEKKEQFLSIDESDEATLDNLSSYFYTMSAGKFRMYFETLKHPETQKAMAIRINPQGIPASTAGRDELNKRIFQKIRELYPPDYDWSRFDNILNNPNYQFDASTEGFSSTYKDHQLDFVILLFRHHSPWNPHPVGSSSGVAWRKAIMGTGAGREVIGYQGDKPVYVGNQGVRIFNTPPNAYVTLELLIHEIAHGMISLPHYNRANKAEGNYLFYPYGWGMMDTYANYFATANAWERWYAGWTEITHDIQPSTHTKAAFVLDDYLATGQSARIQIPHQSQEFIWLEHRKDTQQVYYQRPRRKKDRYGRNHPDHPTGLYAFAEKVASTRSQTYSTNTQGTNGIRVIYGKGNYDYTVEGFENRYYAWDNDVLQVQNKGANAYGGQHEGMYLRHDFNQNGTIERKTNSNGAGSLYIDGNDVYEVDGEATYACYMFHTPIVASKISAFTNPALLNFQAMDWKLNQLAPVILHSLSISQKKLSNGNLQIEVNYEDGKIEDDFRMTGPIVLPADEVITLAKNKTLLLNRSKTINRVRAEEGSLIANSYWDIEGTLILEENAVFIIDEESEVAFLAKSRLVMKAGSKILLRGNAKLTISETAELSIHPSASLPK